MATCISHSPAETEALGEAWGRAAQTGLVIGLSGDLGAGKTQLVKGLARGLGFRGRVHSPTLTIINVYSGGRLTLFHVDLYRLETRAQIEAAALDDYLRPDGVTVIEWAERLARQSPKPEVRIGPVGRAAVTCDLSVAPRGSLSACSSSSWASTLDPRPALLRFVRIEVLSPTERRITYEDPGA